MQTVGRHLIAEFYDCDASRINDIDAMRQDMIDATTAVGATLLSETFHRFEPQGISGTIVIAESHLSIHTWPEARYVAVDIFTCGGLDPRPGFGLLGQRLGAGKGRVQEILRGLPDELDQAKALLPSDVQVITHTASLAEFLAKFPASDDSEGDRDAA